MLPTTILPLLFAAHFVLGDVPLGAPAPSIAASNNPENSLAPSLGAPSDLKGVDSSPHLSRSSLPLSQQWLEHPLSPPAPLGPLGPGSDAWARQGIGAVRGVTIGPIENQRHPGQGYGSDAYLRALDEAVLMGATWVSLTPFGRVYNLTPDGVDLTFEVPFEQNRADVRRAILQARARGLRVMLVPHLWVESGGWRALIDPVDDAGWKRWAASYRHFVLTWAEVAAEGGADIFSVGVELRSWVTTKRAPSFVEIIRDVRKVFPGLLTYSANWDDAEDTLIFGELDLIGINAFYPLTQAPGATWTELRFGAEKVAQDVRRLSEDWGKPVLLTEVGYTNRVDPALRPWEWPESMSDVTLDETAQADALRAVLSPFVDAPYCTGFFVWRLYADPDDVSQEPEYGFSPRGKEAELVMRAAFTASWAADGPRLSGSFVGRHEARHPGLYGWDLAEPWQPQR